MMGHGHKEEDNSELEDRTKEENMNSELDTSISEMSIADIEDRRKNQVLQNYVTELSEQNEILIQTIEGLERDYNQKVASLENRWQKTNLYLKEKTSRCDFLQQRIDGFNSFRDGNDSQLQLLEGEVTRMGDESFQYQTHISNLENDLEELITLIRKARTTGKWEISSVELKSIPIESILDMETIVHPLPRSGTEVITEYHVEELREQLGARDKTIAMLQAELNRKTKECHSIIDQARHCDELIDSVKYDVYDLERSKQDDSGNMAEQGVLIQRLSKQLKMAEVKETDLQNHISLVENEVNELKDNNSMLQNTIEMRLIEIKHKDESIAMLEKQINEAKDRMQNNMVRSHENEDLHFQLELVNSKVTNLQQYIDELEKTHETMGAQHSDSMKHLQLDLKSSTEKSGEYESRINQLSSQLMKEKNKTSNLECQLNQRILDDDVNYKRDIGQREKTTKLLEGQVKRLEEQQIDYENKLSLKDKGMERLQNQQKEYMDEVTKRDSAVHTLELKLLQVEDELRKAKSEVEKNDKTFNARNQELQTLKVQHNQMVGEKGKLEAQVKAYKISTQSEHSTLSGEVTKQEEYIRNLLFEKTKLEEENFRANDEVDRYLSQISDLELKKKDLHKQLQIKDTDLINVESTVQEMKFKELKNTNKIEELEDEIREMNLKLSTSARLKEQEAHKAMLCEEQSKELQHEIDNLISEISKLSKETSSQKTNEEQLSNELNQLKRFYQEKESAKNQLHDEFKKLEHQNTLLSYEVSSLKRDVSEDVSARDHKIIMLEGDLEIANERYTQVNEELSVAELEVQSMSKKYREISDMNEQMHKQIKQYNDDVQRLEMNLAVTSEKHQTSVKENAHKDSAIIKLQSQIDTNQQELEFAVEDLKQTSTRLEQVNHLLDATIEKCKSLEQYREGAAKKIEDYIEEINVLQMKDVDQVSQIKEKNDAFDAMAKELASYQETYENKIRDLETKHCIAEEDIGVLKEENSSVKYQVTCLADKNTELVKTRNKESDEKQAALVKYEELVEKFEEYKTEKEGDASKLFEKVNSLEKDLHSSVLKVSQLDGQLKLSDEKLKHSEHQLIEEQKSCELLGKSVESLEVKTLEQDSIIKTKIDQVEELEKADIDAQSQIEKTSAEVAQLTDELSRHKSSVTDLTSQNRYCEEIITEIRDKLSAKVKENEYLSGVITQLESEYETLKGIHLRTQEELSASEKTNEALVEKESLLENTLIDKDVIIKNLESSERELTEKLQHVVSENTNANTKILQLENKFTVLKESLETDNSSLLEENCVLKQDIRETKEKLKQEVSERTERVGILEETMQEKIKQNMYLEEKLLKVTAVLEDLHLELNQKSEELFNSEEAINEMHLQLQQFLEERKTFVAETTKLTSEGNQLRSDLSDVHHSYKETAQQLAHYQEKCTLIERNLAVTQEQLSARIAANMKQDKLIRRAQNDSKYTQEDRKAKEVQLLQYEHLIDERKEESEKLKEENRKMFVENGAQKSALMTYESQLDQSQKQTEQLLIEVENQKKGFTSSSDSLASAQERLHINEIAFENQVHELEENKHLLALACEREEELQRRVRDSESSNVQLHSELDNFLQKNRVCQEQISSYDAELRVLKADLHAALKKCSQQDKLINRSNHQSDKYQVETQNLKDSCDQMKEVISEQDGAVAILKNELANVQANLEECVQQLTVKSDELASVRRDLMAVQRLHTQSEQQLSIVDGKNKKLKVELRRSLDRIKTSADEIIALTKTVTILKAELQQVSQQQRFDEDELGRKDDEIVTMKVDIASLEEQYKVKDEDHEALKNEILNLNQRHHLSLEELENTKVELEDVKANCDRLTRESEQVIANMNNWVKEQRQGNEKIANKVNLQNVQTISLEAANRKLTEENEKLIQKIKKMKASLEEKLKESERHRRFQSENAQKHVLNEQLKSNNEELEVIISKEREENKENITEFQSRIKANVETIQQLHRQLSELNKENLRQRALLEKQTLSRKNLQAQLKSKENDIVVLKDDLNKSGGNNNALQLSPGKLGKSGKLSVSSMLDKELERAGVSSEEALDKSYWIQRVAELSVQLQQSSDYWMQKLNTASQINSTYR